MLSASRNMRNLGRVVLPNLASQIARFSSQQNNSIFTEYDNITKRGADREKVTYKPGDKIHGFKCVNVRPVPELSLTAYHFIHERTKADYLHLDTADTDNAFSVTFRTPCKNDTGVSHILEHTTLCGSQKYPVHDPFMKMRKRSLQTYMNAWTFDDHTTYPVSSTIPRDLVNLMDVYCDATFFPLLRLADFQQEGWRLENNEVKGVVYNEMKGYQGDPVRSLYNAVSSAYLAKTNYQYVSGGVPSAIPSLHYEDLINFHNSHYHPSNCLFFSYGDIHPSHHMHFLDSQVLYQFNENKESRTIHVSTIPEEALHSPETELTYSCPANNNEPSKRWHYMRIYPTNLTTEPDDIIKLQVLSMLLFRGQSSPFYKSLIESKKAQLFSPLQGYTTFSKNAFFAIGGSEIDESITVAELDDIINTTLNQVLKTGFDEGRIEGLLNEMSLMYKQIKTQFGLVIMQSCVEAWTHNADPSFCLLSEDQLNQMKKEGVNNVMKQMITKYLLPTSSNNGIKRVVVKPDINFFDKLKQEEDEAAKRCIQEAAKAPAKYDISINPSMYAKEVDDSVLPSLTIANIPKKHHVPSPAVFQSSSTYPIHYIETTTNNIIYPRLVYNLDHIMSTEDLLNLPILTYLMNRVDCDTMTAEEMEIKEGQCCSGIRMGVQTYDQYKQNPWKYKNIVTVETSLLMQNNNLNKVSQLISAKLQNSSLVSNIPRIQVLLQSLIAGALMGFNDAIPSYNAKRGKACVSMSNFIDDCYGGYQQFYHLLGLKEIINDEEKLKNYIVEKLIPLQNRVFNNQNMEVFMTSDSANLKTSLQWAEKASNLSSNSSNQQASTVFGTKQKDGYILASQDLLNNVLQTIPGAIGQAYRENKNLFTISAINTNHVFSSHPSIHSTYKHFDTVHILNRILSSNYLLKHVREKGGAYGASSGHDDGNALFSSYDDPHVLETIDQFVKGCEWLRQGHYSQKDINEAKLSLFGDIDMPVEPQSIGFSDVFTGKTSEKRQEQRDILLNADANDLKTIANAAFNCSSDKMHSFVFGNSNSVKQVEKKSDWIVEEIKLDYFCLLTNKYISARKEIYYNL